MRTTVGQCNLLLLLALTATHESFGQNWIQRFPTTSPSARSYAAEAFDAARNQTVLFGGLSETVSFNTLNDTWVWNGSDWTQKFPVNNPPARAWASMAYDMTNSQIVLFGGFSSNGSSLNDTWVWNGSDWTQKFPAHSPSPRGIFTTTYDSAHRQIVLFGGAFGFGSPFLGDTWVWNGSDWTQKFPTTSPSARGGYAMAYDSLRNMTVLFSGVGSGVGSDTWLWNGSNWSQAQPSNSPPPSLYPAMAFDAVQGYMLLFGGEENCCLPMNDTWAWTGVNWVQLQPSVIPEGRYSEAIAYDMTHSQVVMFGGTDGSGFLSDTWVWGVSEPTVIRTPPYDFFEGCNDTTQVASFGAEAAAIVDSNPLTGTLDINVQALGLVADAKGQGGVGINYTPPLHWQGSPSNNC